MKTTKRFVMAFAAVLMMVNLGFAQDKSTTTTKDDGQKATTNTVVTPGKFVDQNKNGVCDNFEIRRQTGRGSNFIDKNGDGICDNRGTMGQGNGKGNCCRMGCQQGHGYGCGYGSGQGKGCGQGRQCRHGWDNRSK